jgi:hypothetical protein
LFKVSKSHSSRGITQPLLWQHYGENGLNFIQWQADNLQQLLNAGFQMNQFDWVGGEKEPAFKDIRNTRDKTAEEKAKALLRLGERINTIPQSIKTGGSVNDVRAWKESRDAAAKVAKNSRSSLNELEAAFSSMQRWFR